MAQSNGNSMQPNQTGSHQQYNNQSQQQTGDQAQNRIDPSHLSSQQIRHIQTALDQKGFKVRHVDGKWGPQTEAAVKKFQQQQNLQGNGRLDRQTLGALGVNMNTPTQQGSATTGSGSSESRSNRPAQNPGAMNGQNGNSKPSVNDGH